MGPVDVRASGSVIDVAGLTRRFGSRRGVTDLDFTIGAGEVFGFLGPNGAGKSTTIRLLLGLYRADSGTMTVLGHDPVRESVHIHRRVGYLPGEVALYPLLTGRRHLDAAARIRGLTDLSYRDELVERFGAELDAPVRTLSKGNRQKIGLVLAFMHKPELLILDEPTSGLDPLLQREFVRLVRETVAEGRTVFLSSHELDEVQRLADRVAIIKEGRLVVTDTVEQLRRNAPRTVELRFDHDVDTRALSRLDGIRVVTDLDGRVTLAVTGPIAPLLRVAADLEPVDMTAHGADLDELFLNYYRQEPHGEATDAH
ncbi:ABC transporter ATP-binding protein [Rhodococcus marinonascens]|uniref:ABC transporter ATP-binding protein n=1 Tax=Rhodococcus marinonascens TaxID=38311 RepID=UPI0009343B97|nr:ABC transporter ATP-binding protein [Rhodococcus marinonascens]